MSNYNTDSSLGESDDAPSLLQSAGPFQTEDVDGHGQRDDSSVPATERAETSLGKAPAEGSAAPDDDVEGHFRLQ